MMKAEIKSILIVGCQRSGTTLLASLLGRHSEVNMLFESSTTDIFRQIGKKYQGNKLLAWRQIRWNQRASKLGHLINRLANFHFLQLRHHYRRPFPISKLSIEDYLKKETIFITIIRDKGATVSSIVKRSGASRALAESEYDKAMSIIRQLNNKGAYCVIFEDLVCEPEAELQRLCKHLEIAFEPKMLEGTKYNFVYPNARVNKEKAEKV